MLAALDVQYTDPTARVGCVLFASWTDAAPASEHAVPIASVAPYEPGEFRKRELPCLLAALAALPAAPALVVVDGYVWLGPGRAGLGAHLFDALGAKTPVVGVAKTRFQGAAAEEVVRGQSAKPLFVTAAGIDPAIAAAHVASMHGPHRIPTLLARADALARSR